MKTFIDNPRNTTTRRWVFQIHLWIGLLLGLYMFVMGLSGSILVFRDEFEETFKDSHKPLKIDSDSPPMLSPDGIASIIKREFPDQRMTNLFLPDHPDSTYNIRVIKNAHLTYLKIHPYTGKVLAVEGHQTGFWNTLADLHINLLNGKTGRIVNGVGALLIITMCITGILIWWQGRKNWKRGFQVKIRAGWKRINWDIHNVIGIVAFLFILVQSVTGAYFAWPQTYRKLVGSFASVSQRNVAVEVKSEKNKIRPALIDYIKSAESVVPGRRVGRIILGEKPNQAIRTVLYETSFHEPHKSSTVYLNPYDASVIRKELFTDRESGDSMVAWLVGVHFGIYGGVVSRLLLCVFGLLLPILFVTGLLMWWNRKVRS